MKDAVVVITGASAGIGAALARQLSGEGAHVALVARSAGPLLAAAQPCGPGAMTIVADATIRADVRRVVREVLARFGHIDVWINNVGQGITRLPSELTDDDIDDMVRVNIKSALYGTQEVLPHFRERGAGQVVNISSMLGRVPYIPFRSAYTGAKHFLNALTASFRAEFAESDPGIQFTLVSPGVVRTEFGIRAVHGGPDSRTLPNSQSAEEVAVVIVEAIRSRTPDVYTRAGARAAVVKYYEANGTDP